LNEHIPGVLVTRPAHQSSSFIKQIEALGATAISLPVIQISPVEPALPDLDLGSYAIFIFISANAVQNGLKYLINSANFAETLICAIGSRTAQTLHNSGITDVILPQTGFNSESLLDLEIFKPGTITGKNVLIIRGQGGREFLADTLRGRGARVDYLEVYKREIPDVDINPIRQLWSSGKINIISVTSNESLKNLYYMCQDTTRDLLLNTTLITPSERCTELARELGFCNQIFQATSATDEAMIKQLKNWLDTN